MMYSFKKITDGRWFKEAMPPESALNSWKRMEIASVFSTGSDASNDFFTFYQDFRTWGKQLQEDQYKKQYTRWWFQIHCGESRWRNSQNVV